MGAVPSSKPILAVWAASIQATDDAPIPAYLSPASPTQNQPSVYIPYRCVPQFGPGIMFDVCPLGDVESRHMVALLGDSHAWMWIPGLALAADALHFELVPLTKPGCLLRVVHLNRPNWPCLTWYSRVLRMIRRLHPSATLVSFMTSNLAASQAQWAAAALQGVMRSVPHPVLIADPPNYNWYSRATNTLYSCLSAAGDNVGTCARFETPQMQATLTAIQTMTHRDSYPVVPTPQWFCAHQVCPAVIDDTVTSEDGSHVTSQYSRLLGPLFADDLRPTLGAIWSRETGF